MNVKLQALKSKLLDKDLKLVSRKDYNAYLPDLGDKGQAAQAKYERLMINNKRTEKGMKTLPELKTKVTPKDILGKAISKRTYA